MEKIVLRGIERHEQVKSKPVIFVDDKKVNDLLIDIENNPHVFFLGCLMQRQIGSNRAWHIPQKVFDILGTHEIEELSKYSVEKYEEIFNENKLHIYNSKMAKAFHNAILDIKNRYNGDVSKIWKNKPCSAAVVYKFLQFKGCGVKIATMTANLLVRHFNIKFSDNCGIDVSPDVHVMRVMKRMGYISEENPNLLMYKARELHPEFPGVIDLLCWEIGEKYCSKTKPKCEECVVRSECKKASNRSSILS